VVLGKVPDGYLCQGEEKAYAYFLQLMLELLNGVRKDAKAVFAYVMGVRLPELCCSSYLRGLGFVACW